MFSPRDSRHQLQPKSRWLIVFVGAFAALAPSIVDIIELIEERYQEQKEKAQENRE